MPQNQKLFQTSEKYMNRTVFECDSKYVTCIHQQCPFRLTLTYYGVLNEKIAASTNNAPSRKPQKTRVHLRFYYLQDTYSNTLKWKNKNNTRPYVQFSTYATDFRRFPTTSISENRIKVISGTKNMPHNRGYLRVRIASLYLLLFYSYSNKYPPTEFWTNATFIPARIYFQFFGYWTPFILQKRFISDFKCYEIQNSTTYLLEKIFISDFSGFKMPNYTEFISDKDLFWIFAHFKTERHPHWH